MSKVALITDIHFGVRNDNIIFLEHQKRFFETVFFPRIEEEGIDTIINLGDTFDRRKFINFNTLYHAKEFFFDELQKRGITMHLIVGNHDTSFKNTNQINSPDLVFREYDNIIRYPHPIETTIGGVDMVMMPWINRDNQEEAYKLIKKTKSTLMFGHFELSDEALKGRFKFEHGITTKDIRRFEYVFSGHYHHKITKKNFQYIGAPFCFDWGDAGAERGFHIFDTETRDIEFIKNPYTLYQKVFWDDKEGEGTALVSVDVADYKDKFIKVIVKHKSSPYTFDRWIDAIEQAGAYNVIIEEPTVHLNDEDVDVDEIEDTITTLKKYINASNEFGNKDKDRLLYLMEELYNEAINTD